MCAVKVLTCNDGHNNNVFSLLLQWKVMSSDSNNNNNNNNNDNTNTLKQH